jgi:hypothetical protein
MSRTCGPLALVTLLLVQCTPTPDVDPWPAHARAIADSISLTLAAYQERFSAADRDSLQRFYADDPDWKWAANGRFGIPSSLMIRSRLDRLAAYLRWHIAYMDPSIRPLAPGLAVVAIEPGALGAAWGLTRGYAPSLRAISSTPVVMGGGPI